MPIADASRRGGDPLRTRARWWITWGCRDGAGAGIASAAGIPVVGDLERRRGALFARASHTGGHLIVPYEFRAADQREQLERRHGAGTVGRRTGSPWL